MPDPLPLYNPILADESTLARPIEEHVGDVFKPVNYNDSKLAVDDLIFPPLTPPQQPPSDPRLTQRPLFISGRTYLFDCFRTLTAAGQSIFGSGPAAVARRLALKMENVDRPRFSAYAAVGPSPVPTTEGVVSTPSHLHFSGVRRRDSFISDLVISDYDAPDNSSMEIEAITIGGNYAFDGVTYVSMILEIKLSTLTPAIVAGQYLELDVDDYTVLPRLILQVNATANPPTIRIASFKESEADTGFAILLTGAGIEVVDGGQDMWTNFSVAGCGTGLKIGNSTSNLSSNFVVRGCAVANIRLRGAQQTKLSNFVSTSAPERGGTPLLIEGDTLEGGTTLENYFCQGTGSGGGLRLQARITSITESDTPIPPPGSGVCSVVKLTPGWLPKHFPLWKGEDDIKLHDVYGATTTPLGPYNILKVDGNDVTIDLPFVEDDPEINTRSRMSIQGYDIKISVPDGQPANCVNDQFFIGGNYNATLFDGGYNISFLGTRLKNRIWIPDRGLNSVNQPNRLFFVRSGRGRTSESSADTPVAGPGSRTGWGEVGYFDDGGTSAPGNGYVAIRVPFDSDDTLEDNVPKPEMLNGWEARENRLEFKANGHVHTVDAADGAGRMTIDGGRGQVAAYNTIAVECTVNWADGEVTTVGSTLNVALVEDVEGVTGEVVITLAQPISATEADIKVLTQPKAGVRVTRARVMSLNKIHVDGFVVGSSTRAEADFTLIAFAKRPAA